MPRGNGWKFYYDVRFSEVIRQFVGGLVASMQACAGTPRIATLDRQRVGQEVTEHFWPDLKEQLSEFDRFRTGCTEVLLQAAELQFQAVLSTLLPPFQERCATLCGGSLIGPSVLHSLPAHARERQSILPCGKPTVMILGLWDFLFRGRFMHMMHVPTIEWPLFSNRDPTRCKLQFWSSIGYWPLSHTCKNFLYSQAHAIHHLFPTFQHPFLLNSEKLYGVSRESGQLFASVWLCVSMLNLASHRSFAVPSGIFVLSPVDLEIFFRGNQGSYSGTT